MAKFIVFWEYDTTKLPETHEQQISLYNEQVNMLKGAFEKRNPQILDLGQFPGSYKGYLICEGTPQEIDFGLAEFTPYIKFDVYPILSLEQILENLKKFSQA
jgi:hypothetical protein